MTERPEAGEVRAAGAVLWRDGADGPEVALVHRPKYDDWSLPKGKAEPGEHVLLTAVREVAEETGQRITLGRRLSSSVYTADGRPKVVDYWAARCRDPAAAFVPSHEVDDLAWLTVGAAARRLSYDRDVVILEEFASGPARTEPLILLRHASAGSRSGWRGADLARPLDARGAADADRLAWLLRCFGIQRVISSAAERCVATVRPYAALAGGTIELEPLFTVGAQVAPETAALRAAALAGRAAVICAHRENLPLLLAACCDRLEARPPAGPPLRKARFWVLHVDPDGTLATAERHGPA
jgi:8-oxo-dGTP pyrophosphatase MutT (NUDIX family)/phosphohistidine phosphatase SixA